MRRLIVTASYYLPLRVLTDRFMMSKTRLRLDQMGYATTETVVDNSTFGGFAHPLYDDASIIDVKSSASDVYEEPVGMSNQATSVSIARECAKNPKTTTFKKPATSPQRFRTLCLGLTVIVFAITVIAVVSLVVALQRENNDTTGKGASGLESTSVNMSSSSQEAPGVYTIIQALNETVAKQQAIVANIQSVILDDHRDILGEDRDNFSDIVQAMNQTIIQQAQRLDAQQARNLQMNHTIFQQSLEILALNNSFRNLSNVLASQAQNIDHIIDSIQIINRSVSEQTSAIGLQLSQFRTLNGTIQGVNRSVFEQAQVIGLQQLDFQQLNASNIEQASVISRQASLVQNVSVIVENLVLVTNMLNHTTLQSYSGTLPAIGILGTIGDAVALEGGAFDHVVSITAGFQVTASLVQEISGMNTLTSIGGYFSINSNTNLLTVTGLNLLTSVGRYFDIFNNAVLVDISGLRTLTRVVDGSLRIQNNPRLNTQAIDQGLASLVCVDGGINGCDRCPSRILNLPRC